jgi:hypothetical protein
MPTPTIKTTDKIKLLDQMLEDIAGDEFDEFNEFDAAEKTMNASAKHYNELEELDLIDATH